MDDMNAKSSQNMAWWIISLAISVVCCAILFVLFANSLMNIKIDAATTKDRLEYAERDITTLKSEVEILRRRSMVQQIQIMPSNGGATVQGVLNGGDAKDAPVVVVPQTTPAAPAAAAPASAVVPPAPAMPVTQPVAPAPTK